ncbi:Isoleucine--tRNA ligase, mitochondrial [Chamberlinius hualienensis]
MFLRRNSNVTVVQAHAIKTLCRTFVDKGTNDYSKSVILPTTNIPTRLDGQKRKEMDEFIFKECDFESMYKQSEVNKDRTFVLHDGPPYANGNPHIGHAVNKILKDVTNRVKLLQGYKVQYIPGWDCHGLPIELKAFKNAMSYDKNRNKQESLAIRNTAREFAKQTIHIQKAAFERWGIAADWNNSYKTYDQNYVSNQLDLFRQIYDKGYIFRDYKPVYWSYSTRTALAEAELEYNTAHQSPSVYFKCLLKQTNGLFDGDVFALLWTTTPWTVPSNRAICYAPNEKYVVVKCESRSEKYIIAAALKEELEATLSLTLNVIKEIEGKELSGVTYFHPLTDEEFRLVPAQHVTTSAGTGLVHTAPAHGHDDFNVAINYNLPVECFVDENGIYSKGMGPDLEGKFVLKEGNETVIKLLQDKIILVKNHIHSYPYDWRSKLPVIIRASLQWFFDTNKIKSTAIEALNNVNFIPSKSKLSMIERLASRPYWCISRQRVWGVPIPVFYNEDSGEPLITKPIIDHFINLVKDHGTDFWWALPDDVLLPKQLLSDSRNNGVSYRKGDDILDIWFDSGSSWYSVLKESNGIADLIIEGEDQITGWFQSTLLLSCALKGESPYKNVYIHGFTVDQKGEKMSKSLGNVVDPVVITDGSKEQPCYGADVLRWWVADHAAGYQKILIGPGVLKTCVDDVHKFRIVLRYLAGVLHNFQPMDNVDVSTLLPLDRYMLHQLIDFKKKVIEAYSTFNYKRSTKLIRDFVANDVSAFYCHLVKDRLYCESLNSWNRQSALYTTSNIFVILLQLLSPVLPFLTEEVYLNQSIGEKPFKSLWESPTASNWEDSDLFEMVQKLLKIRVEVNKFALSNKFKLRNFNLTVILNDTLDQQLKTFYNDEKSNIFGLREFFQVAKVTRMTDITTKSLVNAHICCLVDEDPSKDFSDGVEKCYWLLEESEKHFCPRCRIRLSDTLNTLCSRCSDVLK